MTKATEQDERVSERLFLKCNENDIWNSIWKAARAAERETVTHKDIYNQTHIRSYTERDRQTYDIGDILAISSQINIFLACYSRRIWRALCCTRVAYLCNVHLVYLSVRCNCHCVDL